MRTIRVDEDVYGALQKQAKAFEDSPNSVLRRVLQLKGAISGSSTRATNRAPRGEKIHQKAYREPILRALLEMDGCAPTGAVLDRVAELMKGHLNSIDMEPLPSVNGEPRWRNTAKWEKSEMEKDGLLKHWQDSGKGVWEFTSKGIAAAQKA